MLRLFVWFAFARLPLLLMLVPPSVAIGQVPLGPPVDIAVTLNQPRGLATADFDGDGDLDVVGISTTEGGILWYENEDASVPGTGTGTEWQRHPVAPEFGGDKVTTADVDADGDMDVIAASAPANLVVWYSNDDVAGPGTGDGTTWTQNVVTQSFGSPFAAVPGDLDGDGDLDLVVLGSGATDLVWYENVDVSGPGTGDGVTWAQSAIWGNFGSGQWARVIDFDGDGDLDVVAAAKQNYKLAWFENDDVSGPGSGDGSSWSIHQLQGTNQIFDVAVGDLDGDGDLDIAAASDGNFGYPAVLWFENVDVAGPGSGDGTSWAPVTIGTGLGANSVDLADLDGDGDLDVAASDFWGEQTVVFLNDDLAGPGTGDGSSFTQSGLGAPFVNCLWVRAADIDGDGDEDLVALAEFAAEIRVYLNDDVAGPGTGDGTSWTEAVPELAVRFLADIVPADLDGDGDSDVVLGGASGGRFVWFENVDGSGTATGWEGHVISGGHTAAGLPTVADVDGDGDLDIAVGVGGTSNQLVWFENVDLGGSGTGNASSWTEHVISALDVPALRAGDLDGDGDMDLAVVAESPDAWIALLNDDVAGPGTGDGTSWTQATIASLSDPTRVEVADLDGDGDLDVAGTRAGNTAYAFLNVDQSGPGTGNGTTWTQIVAGSGSFNMGPIESADVDADGDVDLVLTAFSPTGVFWLENVDVAGPGSGDGTTWSPVSIDATFANPSSVSVADVDDDGDLDVLSAGVGLAGESWFENLDVAGPGTGDGSGWMEHVVTSVFGVGRTMRPVDVDGDGDLDFLTAEFGLLRWIPQGTGGPVSTAPVADAGGPFAVDEGGSVSLDGSGSSDDGTIIEWAWDCDGDGTYELVAAAPTGSSCMFVDDGDVWLGLRVTDNDGEVDTDLALVTVANVAPTITTAAATAATEGVPWTYAPTATDPGAADVLTWSLGAGAPTGVGIDGGTGVVSWTPGWTDVGPWPVTIVVADGDGGEDSESFDLVVAFADGEGDGLPDTWELMVGLDPTVDDAGDDGDADGLDNLAEWLGGTDPNVFDGPPTPQPVAPVDGAEVALQPVLSWDPVLDPTGDVVTYDVEVWLDASLSSLHGMESGLAATSWEVDPPAPDNADAYWRVRAADPHVSSPWSDLEPFFANATNDAPLAPVLLEPLGIQVDTAQPTLRWAEAVDLDRDTLDYRVQLQGPDGSSVQELVPALTEWTVADALEEDATYTWTVKPIDEHGAEGPSSQVGTFSVSTSNGAPSAVVWLAPVDGAALEEVAPMLELSTSVDPEGGAVTYVVELATDAGFAEAISLSGLTPQFSLTEQGGPLGENRTWFGRARAEDADGAASSWAQVSWFVRGPNDPPAVPSVVAPAEGEPLSVLVAGHSTDPEGDSVAYEFVVARDAALEDVVLRSDLLPPSAGPEGTADQTSWAPELDEAGDLYWSVRAVDDREAASDWADVRAVDAGCGCATTGRGGTGGWLGLLLLLGWRRRRA